MSRKVSNEYIEEHIKHGMISVRRSEGTVEEADELWLVPVERATGSEVYLQGTDSYTGEVVWNDDDRIVDMDACGRRAGFAHRFLASGIYRFIVAAAAAVLILVGLSYYQYFVRVYATVYLDVNPSVTLAENRVGRIVSADANNTEAEAIIAEADLKGEPTDDAVRVIIGLLAAEGYLQDDGSYVLVSVECGNSARLVQAVANISKEVGDTLKSESGGGSVFSQTVTRSPEIEELASIHKISIGKAALVLRLANDHPDLNADDLAKLSIGDLVKYLHSRNIDLRDNLDYTGEDLDKRLEKEKSQSEQAGSADAGGAGSRADGGIDSDDLYDPNDNDDLYDSDDSDDVNDADDSDDVNDADDSDDVNDADDSDDVNDADDSDDVYDSDDSDDLHDSDDDDTNDADSSDDTDDTDDTDDMKELSGAGDSDNDDYDNDDWDDDYDDYDDDYDEDD